MQDVPLVILHVEHDEGVRIGPHELGHRSSFQDHGFSGVVRHIPVVREQRDAQHQKAQHQRQRHYLLKLHATSKSSYSLPFACSCSAGTTINFRYSIASDGTKTCSSSS